MSNFYAIFVVVLQFNQGVIGPDREKERFALVSDVSCGCSPLYWSVSTKYFVCVSFDNAQSGSFIVNFVMTLINSKSIYCPSIELFESLFGAN